MRGYRSLCDDLEVLLAAADVPTDFWDSQLAAALIGGVAAALVGLLGALLAGRIAKETAREDRLHATDEAARERDHVAKQAQLDRLYAHRVAAYQPTLATMRRIRENAMHRKVDPDDVRSLRASIDEAQVLGSAEARSALDAVYWSAAPLTIGLASSPDDTQKLKESLIEFQKVLAKAEKALRTDLGVA